MYANLSAALARFPDYLQSKLNEKNNCRDTGYYPKNIMQLGKLAYISVCSVTLELKRRFLDAGELRVFNPALVFTSHVSALLLPTVAEL